MFAIIILSICVSISHAFPEASISSPDLNVAKKRCPGGYGEGIEVSLGRYWYQCRDGELVPKGCVTEDNRRIDAWQTYDPNQNYRMQCIVDSRGYLAFTYKSCLYNGREYSANTIWEDEKYYYSCTKDGDYLYIIVSGCIDQGRRVDIDRKVIKGSFVYQCKKTTNGTCSMCPIACTKNGKEYSIGESFESADFVYTCTSDSTGPISIKIIGCMNDRQRLQDGDRYFKNDVVFECSVRPDGADVIPVGCVQREQTGALVERRLGCYWNEGQAPYQYQMTCKYDDRTKTAVKIQHRCMYKVTMGTYTIDPGCFQIVDKTAVSCEKDTSDGMNMRIYQVDEIGTLTAKGLRFC